MKNISIVRINLVKEGELPYITVASRAEDAADIARKVIGDSDRECMISIMLNVKNHVNAVHTISIGSLSSAVVHPREVFKAAILCNSASIIIAHNHPSGDLRPSQEDILLTRRLRQAGEILGINVLDHIIVGNAAGHFSFLENSMLSNDRV